MMKVSKLSCLQLKLWLEFSNRKIDFWSKSALKIVQFWKVEKKQKNR